MGGVGGALAQHAEATLEKIGNDRITIVRELFRNLVTVQGTRAARDMEELLSVFEDRDAAKGVLQELVDARLLTTYDVPAAEEEEAGHSSIEIIHESLLTAWPRLVRWQTQDADGAQMRDQLRQAARLWQERGRPLDLLWTGTSFNEFKIWRERYSGGLTASEESFAQAMVHQAGRRRRRRRLAATTAFVVLLGVVGVVGILWQQAVAEARRAEAAKLRALGQLELEERPSAAIAYAIASLELNDDPEVRRFALEALWKGPTELWISKERYVSADFSHDGRWLALGIENNGQNHVFPLSGGDPLVLEGDFRGSLVQFYSRSDFLVSSAVTKYPPNAVDIWSIPDGRRVKRMDTGNLSDEKAPICLYSGYDRTVLLTIEGDWSSVYAFEGARDEPIFLGRVPVQKIRGESWSYACAVDLSGTRFAYPIDKAVYVSPLDDLVKGQPIPIGRHDAPI